jgi:tetratricopeptide (TPR) repeat protein
MKDLSVKIICVSSFIFLLNLGGIGQSTDSTILKTISVAKELVDTDAAAALQLANSAFIDSRETDFERGIAESYLIVGRCYIQTADELAQKSLRIALKYAEKIKDKALISDCYFYLGKSCFVTGDTRSQLDWYNKAYEIRRSLNDQKRLADSYHGFGNVYLKLNQDSMAENYFILSREIREKLNDVKGLAAISNNLALIAGNRGDTLLYRKLMHQSRNMNEQSSNKRNLATNHGNLGMNYLGSGNYDSAWYHCFKAFEIRKINDFKDHLSGSYSDLGKIRFAQKRYTEALEFFKQGAELAESISGYEWLIGNYFSIAEVYARIDSQDMQIKYKQMAEKLQKEHKTDTLLSKKIPPPPAFDFAEPKKQHNYWVWWTSGSGIILIGIAFARMRRKRK